MLCGRTEEVGLKVGPPRHRHFVGFSSVPVRAPTRGQPFTVITKNRLISVTFHDVHGDTKDQFSSEILRVPTGELI